MGDDDGLVGIEIISPILHGFDGLREVKTMCEALDKMGAICSVECGLHVNVDAKDIDGEHRASLVLLYNSLEENGLLDCVAEWRLSNRHCQSLDPQLIKFARAGPFGRLL